MKAKEFFSKEHEQFEESLLEQRYNEQKRNNDYDINEDGEIEKCECGNYLNSHGHCPQCDY